MFYGMYCKLFKRLMQFRPVYWWGKISFSACIWHIPVAKLYRTVRDHTTLLQNIDLTFQLGLYFTLLVVVSTISYCLIEIKNVKTPKGLKGIATK